MHSCRLKWARLSGNADDQSRNHERARKLLDAAGRRAWNQEVKNSRATEASNTKRSSDTAQSIPQPIWMETEARVTECRHELPKVRKLPLRVTRDPDTVIVSFTCCAHAQIYYDDFRSPVARPQGEAFPVYYNALNPRRNTLSPSQFVNRRPRSDTAILGFILVSILFLPITSG
jgi:hypothetical protein